MNFSSQLKLALKQTGMTQVALSKASGVRQSAISAYCQGNGLPSAEALYALAKALNVSMEWLLVGEEGENQNSELWHARATEAETKLAALGEVLPLISKANSILSEIVSK